AVHEASHTVKEIKQIDIDHIHAKVENGQITKYRVDARISFIVRH
ncbi:MAG: dodecin domain-containing protein, partial [Verrucomicrobia bacterium]|nr:dodecin domain-containing protein [Verrucomicrobiota bacterium]